MKPQPFKLTPQEWANAISDAFRSSTLEGVLCAGAALFATCLDAEQTARAARTQIPPPRPANPYSQEADEDDDETEALAAALLLGVRLDSNADEIRAALRRRMSEARVHPDHGGDAEAARRLIDAKNLLVERIGASS